MKLQLSSMMKVLALFCMATLAHASSPIEGRWHTPGKEGTVEIEISDKVLSGKLVASTHEEAKIGAKILRDFVSNGKSWKGKVYIPKKDKTLDAELSLQDGSLKMKVSAGLRSKSIIWTRAESKPASNR